MYDQKNDNLISRSDAQALILSHDGDCALLHLWMALTGSKDLEQAARDLCMTRAQVDSASEKLNRMGIRTVRDIQEHNNEIIRSFGKQGQWMTQLAAGIDDRLRRPRKGRRGPEKTSV